MNLDDEFFEAHLLLVEAYPLCLQQLLEHEQEIPYLHVFTFALDCGFVLDAISGFYAPSFLVCKHDI